MKRIMILLCFIFCMTIVFTVFAGATDNLATVGSESTPEATFDATPDATPDVTPDVTPGATKGTNKKTAEPIATNKGEIQVLNPGNTEASVNSTGKIIIFAAIILVCLFFVVEGLISLFIKKK